MPSFKRLLFHKLFFTLLGHLLCFSLHAQLVTVPLKRIRDLKENQNCYTLTSATDFTIRFCKGDDASQLNAYGGSAVWIGKDHPYSRYTDVVITFSQPVTSVSFSLSHFNNDTDSGRERVGDFHLYSAAEEEIPYPTILWSAFEKPEVEFTTVYDAFRKEITATEGGWGDESGGTLTFSSVIPFTQVTFRQTALFGHPNGVIIDKNIQVQLAGQELQTVQTAADSLAKDVMNDKELRDTLTQAQQQQLALLRTKVLQSAGIPKDSSSASQLGSKTGVKKSTTVKTVRKPPSATPGKKQTVQRKASGQQRALVTHTPKTTVKKAPVVSRKKKTVQKQPELKEVAAIRAMQPGDKIKLERVYFKQSLPELLPGSFGQLDTLVLIMKQLPALKIQIMGHTDNQGNPQLNLELSDQRALAVKQYLVNKGIAADRLQSRGYGSTRPLFDNNHEENRRKNRRVEFMILSL